MTIFQKMLFTPVLALVLFTAITAYSYNKQRQSTNKIENFSQDYIPIIELGNKNAMLLEQISQQIKDAIVANETSWLDAAEQSSQILIDNFEKLKNYSDIASDEQVQRLNEVYLRYYSSSVELAQQAVKLQSILDIDTHLIERVESYQKETKSEIIQFNTNIKEQFLAEVYETNREIDNILLTGGIISIFALLTLLLVTLYISLSTRKSILAVVARMKQLSQGETDFSHRLSHDKKDEIGYLIHWFNKLSDKLESNFLEVEKVSVTDQLTKLNNRTRFESYFPVAIETAKTNNSFLSAVILDIDHFKSVNDTYGHLVGDEVLKTVASLLKQEATSYDFIGRLGGEEFIILVKEQTPEEVFERINNIRQKLEEKEIEDVRTITASFGIATMTAADSQTTLLKRADEMLYKAKESGRNKVLSDQLSNSL